MLPSQKSPFRGLELDFIGGCYDELETSPESSPVLNRQEKHQSGRTASLNDPLAAEPIDVLLLDDNADKNETRSLEVRESLRIITQDGGYPMSRTPSIPIATSSRNQSKIRDFAYIDVIDATPTIASSNHTITKHKKRRKKKANNEKKNAGNALESLRGFSLTPGISGDESDFSTHNFPKRDISMNTSAANSPFIRPLSRTSSITTGISALRQKIDTLRLARTSSNTGSVHSPTESRPKSSDVSSMTSGYQSNAEDERPPMESYEVPLDEDFISNDIEQQEPFDPLSPVMSIDNVHRRMTALDFDVLTCLGKGSFGTVHLVRQKATGRLFAQKMFRKASLTVRRTLIEQTKTERAILESINRHPFIVNLYYAFQDKEKLYLILEYAQGGELFTHLAAEHMFPEETTAFYMAEMIVALNYLHETGIVYRDLKPENCLLDAEGHLLLTDFGLSKEVAEDADACTSILGTWEYMAPEVIEGKNYDKSVDWWSLGAVAFDLLTGNPPFTGNNHKKIQEKIIKGKFAFPYFLTPDAKDLLTRLLRRDPRKRLGSNMPKDLQTFKTHRFFRKLDWKKLENRELEPPIRPVITDPALAENFSPEFTQLALSPRAESAGIAPWNMNEDSSNPFGGFSYVASKSLFRSEGFLTAAMQMEMEEDD